MGNNQSRGGGTIGMSSPLAANSYISKIRRPQLPSMAPFRPRRIRKREFQTQMWVQFSYGVPVYANIRGFGASMAFWGRRNLNTYLFAVKKLNPLDMAASGGFFEVPSYYLTRHKYLISTFAPQRNFVGFVTDVGTRWAVGLDQVLKTMDDPAVRSAVNLLKRDYPQVLEVLSTRAVPPPEEFAGSDPSQTRQQSALRIPNDSLEYDGLFQQKSRKYIPTGRNNQTADSTYSS